MITGYKVDRCHFCGAPQVYLHLRKSVQEIQVRCGKCGAEGPSAQTEEDAIEKWNKRRNYGKGK